MSFALSSRGLHSFNAQGEAGIISDDLSVWEAKAGRGQQIVPYKGGVLFAHTTGIYWYPPGGRPISVGPENKQQNLAVQPPSTLTTTRGGEWCGIVTAGDWFYTMYSHPNGVDTFVMAASPSARDPQNPTELAWQCLYNVKLP